MQPDSYSVFASRMLAEKMQELCAGGEIVPLYSQPQPTLTAGEREAIRGAISAEHQRGAWQWAETLRKLLERLA
jgi:hypothetical protein